ncbi:MAG: HlyD family efflux transporter periplasmic adaptor subunit [Bacteroidota bacterium]
MKKDIFPFELVNNSVEALHVKHHTNSRILYLTVLLALIGGLAVLPFVQVQVSTQSRGIIRSESNNNAINVGIYGQVEAIYIEESQAVVIGDTLLVLRTNKLQEQSRHNEIQITEYKNFIHDLNVLMNDHTETPSLKTALYKQTYLQYQRQLSEYQLTEKQRQKELELGQKLYDAGSLPKVELEQRQFQLDLATNAKQIFEEQQAKSWEAEWQQYQEQWKKVRAENQQIAEESKQYVVTASQSGTIVQYSGIKAGNFVHPNQEIAQISANDDLIVESYVSPADIGLIQVGMNVNFQVDAFNYNQWGLAKGEVTAISQDIVSVQDQPFFVVKCQLSDANLRLKNGYIGNFKKGMTLSARYAIADRTLFQLLYDKVDDWLNPNLG